MASFLNIDYSLLFVRHFYEIVLDCGKVSMFGTYAPIFIKLPGDFFFHLFNISLNKRNILFSFFVPLLDPG